ncbi:ribonuclease HII [Bacillus haikouensis]|uniref:ribonuclease HII n=1 Tax=Bacillus haikouensis TaxID=1510468 RepID=UPI002483610A|nr:ribonuclease HII [Bacillus haikouensis]
METKDLSVNEIKLLAAKMSEDDPLLKKLKKDNRKGVQKIIEQYNRNLQRLKKEKDDFSNLTILENKIVRQGYSAIAGIDEVGRGPLAGPVVAAAVILPQDFYLPGINDSKQLSETKRNEFYDVIREKAVSIGIGMIDAEEIDTINIYEATKKAMLYAISNLQRNPDYLLIDAMKLDTPYPQESIIKGDSKSVSIAAASIVAKVTRDKLMKEYALTYPGYGFDKNAGYGTKGHLEGLKQNGVTPIHRKSFAPVRDIT